jgi:YVTN family beta-propeller protein
MRRKITILLVIGVSIALFTGVGLFFYSCAGAGGETGNPQLYVGGYNSANETAAVYVVKPDAKEVVKTIDLPGTAQPDWLTISPDGKKLYCSSTAESKVYIIDAETNTYEKSVSVCPNPKGIAFTPDGSKAVVGCFYDLSIIDVATGSYTNNDLDATISGFFGQIGGIQVHPTNNKLYAAVDDGYIAYSNVAGSATVTRQLAASVSLADIAVSSGGDNLYTSAEGTNYIVICTINSGDGSVAVQNEGLHSAVVYFDNIALSPDNKLLYMERSCASDIDYVETSNPTNVQVLDIAYLGIPEYGQRDVVFSSDSSLAFVLFGSISVHKIVVVNTKKKTVEGAIDLPENEYLSLVYAE